MRKLTTHSRASLFLMEMIFSLLVLAIACSAGVQIFAAARRDRLAARELNHIQELTSTVGEILEGSDGKPETILALLPGGQPEENSLTYFYDRAWEVCDRKTAAYRLEISLHTDNSKKSAGISFSDASGKELYRLDIRFPVSKTREEDVA